MRKLPGNPGLNEDGDTFCCLSRQVETFRSLYLEASDGRLYLDVLDNGTEERVTFCMDKEQAERIVAGLQRLLPQLKTWTEIKAAQT